MKKYIPLVLFILIPFTQLHSQTSIGVIAGLNLQSLTGDSPDNTSYAGSTGFMYGLSAETKIFKDFKLMIQPNYSLTETIIQVDIGREDPVDSFRVKLDYFRVPVIAKIEALNGVTYFLSGLDMGFLSKATIQNYSETSDEADLKDGINEFDLAAMFGVGVKFKLSRFFVLGIEGRYSQSLLNMSKDNTGTQFSNLPSRFRQAGFQFLTCISYNL